MRKRVAYRDLGMVRYTEAWEYQKSLILTALEAKKKRVVLHETNKEGKLGFLLLCEHPHVFTLGKSGKESNLLVNEEFLKGKGFEFIRSDRGGDITYHGPGQIVGYPIFDIGLFGFGVKHYIYNLEEVIIQTLKKYSLKGERLSGATGVWMEAENSAKTRKICAIGVKVSNAITMHGFALNVNTDLDFFSLINPCGFTDKGVTSMQKETGKESDIQKVKQTLLESFKEIFKINIEIQE